MSDCYADTYFVGLWGHENPQDPICARSRTVFVVTFSNCNLLWLSKPQRDISLSTMHSEYVTLSHSFRDLITLKIIIKEVIDNLGIDIKNLKFVSRSTAYKGNNGFKVVTTSPWVNPISKNIAFKYHWFSNHFGKEFMIRKIKLENHKTHIFTKGLNIILFQD